MNKPLELLAPARDKECAIAAINFGADAIYIGPPEFGARKNASNTLDDIKEVVDFAHKFFARVYVTLNTILRDDELDKVQKLLYKLYDIGVDGIIVQDFAIFKMDLPPFLISASTQCDIRDVKKAKFFEKIGLDRVILARELSIEDVREIYKNTNIEIETFVHGALCVSYSGQCYLSCAIGGRSSNRGECAQPCRMKYSLVGESGKVYAKNKYLLSLKDFCAVNYLNDLINAGVASFKIEGRLKDKNYVKNVCAFYNIALGSRKRISSGKIFYDFVPDINKTFNRGYTNYFLDGKGKNIYNFDTPKHFGEKIGTVTNLGKDFLEIKTNVEINIQDGLCYFLNNDLKGFLVNKIVNKKNIVKIHPNVMPKIRVGTEIFRNLDFKYNKFLDNSKTRRKITVIFYLYNDRISVVDEDNIECSIKLNFLENGNDCQKMKIVIDQQLKKSGDSDFYVEKVEFCCQKIPFFKISKINALRRELLKMLTDKRIDVYKEMCSKRVNKKISIAQFPLINNDYRLNMHNSLSKEFYLQCGVDCIQSSYETKRAKNAELMRTRHCLRRAFDICLKNGADTEKLFLINEKNKKFDLDFDCKNCEMIIREN